MSFLGGKKSLKKVCPKSFQMIRNAQKQLFEKKFFFMIFLHTSSNFLRLLSHSEKKLKVIVGFSMECSINILALRFFGGLYKQQFKIEDNFSKIALTSVNFLRTLMNQEGKNSIISRFRMENTTDILALKFLIAIHTFPLSVKRYVVRRKSPWSF